MIEMSKALERFAQVRAIRPGWPPHSEVLIWDLVRSELLQKVFESESPSVLPIRGEIVYLGPALRALLGLRSGLSWTERYSAAVIRRLRPQVVITGTDNNRFFYTLKGLSNVPEAKFAAVQFARRTIKDDLFETPPEPNSSIDFLFTLGPSEESLYRPYAGPDCKVEAFGSLKMNTFYQDFWRHDDNGFDYICYISDYRDPFGKLGTWTKDLDGRPITFDQIWEAEIPLLHGLRNLSIHTGLPVLVASSGVEPEKERAHFEKHLGHQLETIVEKSFWSSYHTLARSALVVAMDSTMGYEALSLGKRAIICPIRVEEYNVPPMRFGWPINFETYGPFWMNRWDESDFLRIASEVLAQSPKRFFAKNQRTIRKIIAPAQSPSRVRESIIGRPSANIISNRGKC